MAKVLISLPDDLLERIDGAVREHGGNRSAFLAEAARRQLGWPAAAELDAALRRGREALSRAGRFESAELIRAERLARDGHDRRHQ
jgi:Arc/MetJ-type ribon-helix-helix transcriptional regulator